MSGVPETTETQLRDALAALADGVHPAPDAYRAARGDWMRRERRRRLLLAVLVAVVFTLATLIGMWVLNQASSSRADGYDGTGHSRVSTSSTASTMTSGRS